MARQVARTVVATAKGMLGEAAALASFKRLLRRLPMGKALALGAGCLEQFPTNERTQPAFQRATLRSNPAVTLELHPQCLFSRLFALIGFHEFALTRELLSSRYSGVLVDIGANFGYFAALWLGKSDATRALAIEPVPANFALLRRNLEQFGDRAATANCCVGDGEGAVRMTFNPEWPMHAAVEGGQAAGGEFSVQMRSLPALMTEHGLDRVDVVKVDAEGLDVRILNSARQLFAERRVGTVFWEYSDSDEARDLVKFLEQCSYHKVTRVDGAVDGMMGFTLRIEGA